MISKGWQFVNEKVIDRLERVVGIVMPLALRLEDELVNSNGDLVGGAKKGNANFRIANVNHRAAVVIDPIKSLATDEIFNRVAHLSPERFKFRVVGMDVLRHGSSPFGLFRVYVLDDIKSPAVCQLILGFNHIDFADIVEELEDRSGAGERLDILLSELLGGNVADTPIAAPTVDEDPHGILSNVLSASRLDDASSVEVTLNSSSQILEFRILQHEHVLKPLAALSGMLMGLDGAVLTRIS